MRVVGGVLATIRCEADDSLMHSSHHFECCSGLFGSAECGGGNKLACCAEAIEGMASVIGMFGDTGHSERVHQLHEKGA